MGILGALFSGVSGLNVYSQAIEVIGNNIANANTPGFKGGRAEFANILARSLSGSQGGNQVGRGVSLANVETQFTQGSFETTSSGTDLAIDGRGFFIVKNSDGVFYTRAGLFTIDAKGLLVTSRGDTVQGVSLDSSGNPSGTIQDLNLTVTNNPPKKTTKANFVANLDATASALGSAGTATSGSGVTDRFQFVTGKNEDLIFSVDGGTTKLTADLITNGSLVSGAFNTGTQVAAAIKKALEAQNGVADTYTVSYSTTTRKFTITNDTGNTKTLTLLHSDTTTGGSGSTASDDLGFAVTADDTAAAGASAVSDNQVQFNVVSGRNQFDITLDGAFYVKKKTVSVAAGGYTGDQLAQAIEAAINAADVNDSENRIRAVRVTYNAGSNVNKFQIISQTNGGERTINVASDSNSFTIPSSSIRVTETGGGLSSLAGVLSLTNLGQDETFVFDTGVNDQVVVKFGAGADTPLSLITHGGLTSGKVHTTLEVAAAIKQMLESQDGDPDDVYTVTYNSGTDKFTIAGGATNTLTTTLRWTQAGSTAAAKLGFSTAADDTVAPAGSTTSDVTVETQLITQRALVKDGTGNFDVTDPSNLSSSTFSTSIILFDSLGSPHSLNVFFRKIGENVWEYNGVMLGKELVGPTADTVNEQVTYGRLWFTEQGALDLEDIFDGATKTGEGFIFPRADRFNFAGGATQKQDISFDFGNSITTDTSLTGGLDGVTQFAGASAVINQTQDGFTTGTLVSISINRNGNITGQFTNGQTRDLARIVVANFNSPGGLNNQGNSLFAETQNSGQPILGQATTAGFGNVLANSIEISNVDIAEEFVRLIRDQQAFQANARLISTNQDLLNEVVNLTR